MDMANTPRPPLADIGSAVTGQTAGLPISIPLRVGPAGRFYLSLRAKFAVACIIAVVWTGLSVCLSMPWMLDLAAVIGTTAAALIITFIAYIPGFMNAFLLSTLLLDRSPLRRAQAEYPGASVLVAAYNEAAAIRDTLTSLARQDYPGPVEILVLNDGSSDDTLALAEGAIAEVGFPRTSAPG
jgi:poly-beta-1,6-N-acetyl-D-glucosamine synthase